ncbi:MAG: DUF4911 domain-containing protein [Myxococcales bacterium]|jgi:hypothetical protein
MPARPPLGPGLVTRRVRVADPDVIWIRAILEAYDGLAFTYGDGSGVLALTTTESQAGELDGLLNELSHELCMTRIG